MNTPPTRKLLDQVRDVLRLKHYSIRTEEAYVDWIRRFVLFHGKRHPQFLRQRHKLAIIRCASAPRCQPQYVRRHNLVLLPHHQRLRLIRHLFRSESFRKARSARPVRSLLKM